MWRNQIICSTLEFNLIGLSFITCLLSPCIKNRFLYCCRYSRLIQLCKYYNEICDFNTVSNIFFICQILVRHRQYRKQNSGIIIIIMLMLLYIELTCFHCNHSLGRLSNSIYCIVTNVLGSCLAIGISVSG